LFRILPKRNSCYVIVITVFLLGLWLCRAVYLPARAAVEAIDPALHGYLGGLGLPILVAWPIGGLVAGLAAWGIGKISLRLRSDYLAIATLGISEIIVAILKNEDWLARGVKNVTAIPRPVPEETMFQNLSWVQSFAAQWGADVVTIASILAKLCYAGLFGSVLLILLWMFERAWQSPWGRMMRAIRDQEVAAAAMGKDIGARHLQVFVLGSAVVGIAGAMLISYNGQFTPSSFHPLRFTFLIWVMVIVGGAGNNWGTVLGGFLIWFYWVEAEPIGLWVIDGITSFMAEDHPLRKHLLDSAAHMRLITMGIILLLVMRFHPRGLLPERS
ncbi:MAG: branched-chain amino acid ABC transporter permease, partial [Pseudomonadota bacterium]